MVGERGLSVSTDDPLVLNPTAEAWLEIRARVRGESGLRRLRAQIGKTLLPAQVRLLMEVLFSSEVPTLAHEELSVLRGLGVLVTSDELPADERFLCPLDTSRAELVPYLAALRAAPELEAARYRLAPRVYLQTGHTLPAELEGRCLHMERFAMQRPILWVEDEHTGIPAPFWPGGAVAEVLDGVLEGRTAAAALPDAVFRRLAHAGVLVDPAVQAARATSWRQALIDAKVQLERDEYVVLTKLLQPLQLHGLRRYFRHLRDHGSLVVGDGQVDLRSVVHNEPVARFLHLPIAALLDRIVPEPIKPSYCIVGMYDPGSVLRKHVDREQCAWNVSLAIDADPETEVANAWPLHIEARGHTHEIRLGMGDAVLYRGTRNPHWRNALRDGQRDIVCFFHFVPADYEGGLG